MTPHSIGSAPRTVTSSAVYWALVGALASFGIAALMTIGVFVLAAAAILAGIGAWLKIGTRGLPGMIIGAAVTPFYIALLNRSGPGWSCTRTATSTSCSQQANPWWFVAVGVAMVAIGAILLLRRRRPVALLTDPPYPGATGPDGTHEP